MQLIRGYKQQNKLTGYSAVIDGAIKTSQCVATIGNFDGVHLGHQKIIQRVIQIAKQMALASCVILFEPHPKEYFLKQKSPSADHSLTSKISTAKKIGYRQAFCFTF
ncbi:MAG: adenylyltransferase/cytidyltransferase family protein [Enterobacterales bacterium]|nr:adenylyltransferase/cytidyltransferase family protein [Enterobacterales bacterium]